MGHGFASAALSQSIRGAKIFNHRHVGLAAIVTNAILQGSISELMGGKFANGAMSSAFRVAFKGKYIRQASIKYIRQASIEESS